MEKEYLSIKQIADKLGVPKQRVYRCIKKYNISEAHKETVSGNTVLMYDETAFQKVSDALIGVSSEAHHSESNETKKAQNDILIEALLKQLEEKDKQIANLQASLLAQQQVYAEQQKVLALERKREAVDSEPEEQPKKRWWRFW